MKRGLHTGARELSCEYSISRVWSAAIFRCRAITNLTIRSCSTARGNLDLAPTCVFESIESDHLYRPSRPAVQIWLGSLCILVMPYGKRHAQTRAMGTNQVDKLRDFAPGAVLRATFDHPWFLVFHIRWWMLKTRWLFPT